MPSRTSKSKSMVLKELLKSSREIIVSFRGSIHGLKLSVILNNAMVIDEIQIGLGRRANCYKEKWIGVCG